jgi:hypothetical protein
MHISPVLVPQFFSPVLRMESRAWYMLYLTPTNELQPQILLPQVQGSSTTTNDFKSLENIS